MQLVSSIVQELILLIKRLKHAFILALHNGNYLDLHYITNVCNFAKIINLQINFILQDPVRVDKLVQMVILQITKLHVVSKLVLKLIHFIMKTFLQEAVYKFVLAKVMPIIKIRHVFTA